jgi:probable HAF family extracellular repeat protein
MRQMRIPSASCAALAATATFCLSAWCGRAVAEAPFFTGLGDLPGGDFSSSASAVSATGSVVVGSSNSATGAEAFRWTPTSGMTRLGDLSGGPTRSYATDLSANGTIIVGKGWVPSITIGRSTYEVWRAARWAWRQGIVDLGHLGGIGRSSADGVSADGNVVVGSSSSSAAAGLFFGEAFRWTPTGGMTGLGDLPGGIFNSVAYDVSSDGTVVVGAGASASGSEAFRWTPDAGMAGLGDLAGGDFESYASAVSDNGSVVVGRSHSTSGYEAFHWTEAGGMVGLGDLSGGDFNSGANAISADGATIVGFSNDASGSEAFVWDATHGMRNLRDVLVDAYGLGTSLAGWSLNYASAISADGRTIVGVGTNPAGYTEAWLARLDAELPTPGDFNGDDVVDSGDFAQWQGDFGSSGDSDADGDHDSDGADFLAWQRHFGRAPSIPEHAAVPEPAMATLIMFGGGLIAAWRRFPKHFSPEMRS